MFAPTVPASSVCLRCQLRLANSAVRRVRPGAASVLHARRFSTQEDPFQELQIKEEPVKEQEQAQEHEVPRRERKSRLHERRVYTSRGKRLLVKSEKLGVDTLGRPSEAIVFRDGGEVHKSPIIREEIPAADVKPVNVLDAVEKEGRSPRADEVMQNIQELRPAQSILTEREYMDAFDQLLHGFTTLQLESYIVRHGAGTPGAEGRPIATAEDLAEPTVEASHPWIVKQWKWIPQVPDADAEVDPYLRGYVLTSMTPKEKLVARLMRGCWGLSVHELLDRPGRLDVEARDPEFSLLALGPKQWLQSISEATPEPGKQIELLRSKRLIRISARKVTAETILDEIAKTLNNVRARSFETNLLPAGPPYDTQALDEVGRIADAVVRYNESKTEIQVTWIEQDTRDPSHEDVCDIVFRLLLTAHPSKRPNTYLTAVGRDRLGMLVAQYTNKDKMMWKDRMEKWARMLWRRTPPWADGEDHTVTSGMKDMVLEHDLDVALAMEVAAANEVANAPPAEPTNESEASSAATTPPPVNATPSASGNSATWSPRIHTSTKAIFGHILHPVPGLTAVMQQATMRDLPASPSSSRVLVPVIPPLKDLTVDVHPSLITTRILLRFLPLPSSAPPHPSAPPLELSLVARAAQHSPRTPPQPPRASVLRAVVGPPSVADILLPSGPVDVRAVQTRYAELPWLGRSPPPGTLPLMRFLGRSSLELLSGSLATPARLPALGIPRRLLTAPRGNAPPTTEDTAPASVVDSASSAAESGADELVEVDYVFAGLEVHRTVEGTFLGWKLAYTSIDAGRGGGQRAELSLEAVPGMDPERGRKTADLMTTKAFLESVHRLADGQDGVPWLGARM
ncbi:hypothetical protein NKR23_g1631 [Pleurostoma richardsiae]|uniref:Uncharacterized protein n=1 Tax=Pleurostoma richardsiae TaxID=41990 RepID=A0AA38RRI1_9PEZI|nr:hypothetical protein NKR23_g1631 [Pleurostoma richardsiae]